MTCRSCGFENMKNSATCARCGAKLVWKEPVRRSELRPGRSGGGRARRRWRRLLAAWRRRLGGVIPAFPGMGVFWRIPKDNQHWGFLSVVPGLGHFFQGRVKEGLVFLTSWILIFVLSIVLYRERVLIHPGMAASTQAFFFWVGVFSMIAPSVLAGVHGYAILSAMRLPDFCRTAGEARSLALAVAIAVFLAYAAVVVFVLL